MKSLIELYLYASVCLVLFMTCLVVMARYQAMLPWLVVVVVLVIVARLVWWYTRW